MDHIKHAEYNSNPTASAAPISAAGDLSNYYQKAFIFLYPQQEIFDIELNRLKFKIEHKYYNKEGSNINKNNNKNAAAANIMQNFLRCRDKYSEVINSCIDARYRQKGYNIFFAILDNCSVSNMITVHKSDRVIRVGMDSATHRSKNNEGIYPYPDNENILQKLGNMSSLVVTGFHMWDCVEKLAQAAHAHGINTLVDEDLTEFFRFRFQEPFFRVDTYPTFNPYLDPSFDESSINAFLSARKDKPWLIQDYKSLVRKDKV